MTNEKKCLYYQATVERTRTWYLVAALKLYDHLCLDRTIDAEKGILEFFVPECHQDLFLQVMQHFIDQNIISNLQKKPNRLAA